MRGALAGIGCRGTIAAFLPPQFRPALFASVMHDPAPLEESGSQRAGRDRLQRQVVDYPTAAAPGTISSIPRTLISFSSSATARRSATASALAAMASLGPARRP